MTWAQRLKRVFNIDVSTCDACGGAVKIIASIEDRSGPVCLNNDFQFISGYAATGYAASCEVNELK